MELLILFLYMGWCVVNECVASVNKRMPPMVGGLLSLAFTPLLVWLYLVAVGRNADG